MPNSSRCALESKTVPCHLHQDEWPGGEKPGLHNLPSGGGCMRIFQASISVLNYDPSHLVWMQMDYVAPLAVILPIGFFHVHAKDVRVRSASAEPGGNLVPVPSNIITPKLPGLGQVDWGHFFSQLNEIGYQGPVCVEVEESRLRRFHRIVPGCVETVSYLPAKLYSLLRVKLM